jgi:glycosyltransferase involved in cell wall biosynthesis
MPQKIPCQVWLVSCGAWHLPHTAKGLAAREALAGLWISLKNSTDVPAEKFKRCHLFHLAMKPFYHCASSDWTEKAFYRLFPLWRTWFKQQRPPEASVVQAIMGYATEPFVHAEATGALKVVDCPNSYPVTYHTYWQRECDQWCPGEKMPIPRWMLARMRRELEQADMILCPSIFVRDSMIANGIPEEKCFINPFGVDTSVFKPRLQVPLKPRFITVGTICLRKGHQYLFRAFEKVRQQMPEAELICVGAYKSDFRLERPRWTGSFTHIPALNHIALSKLLGTCTAFVFPSCEEGFARVIPEAMAVGLPIIASHESGATTLVTDGVEGLIVPPQQPEAIAEAMLKVARDAALGKRLGRAAYVKGAVCNTWQDYSNRLLTEYARRLAR